jgi:hypothetical protein
MSTFFCPAWGHEVVYKNNHTISATFIESVSSKEEDLRAVFGIGQSDTRPCFGAQLFDPITQHGLCTFSSALEIAPGNGFTSLDLAGTVGINGKRKAVDIVFTVDGSSSMDKTISAGGDTYSKYLTAMDVIKKIVVAYDDYQMPGTYSWGGTYKTPAFSFGGLSGNLNTPPWPIKLNNPSVSLSDIKNYRSLIGELYESDSSQEVNLQLQEAGYDLSNFDRFKISIEQKRTNIGLVMMTSAPRGANHPTTVIDISDHPTSFDKLELFNKISNAPRGTGGYECFTGALSSILAMLYNSPRAEYVTDRIIIALTDFVTTGFFGTTTGSWGPETYDPEAFKICQALQKGGELAKRRPIDRVLETYGKTLNVKKYIDKYEGEEVTPGVSRLQNPDKGSENPGWYNDEIPTMVLACQVGASPRYMSKYAPIYAYDYKGEAPPFSAPINPVPQFYFPITSSGLESNELERMMDLIKLLEQLTKDEGYQNVFSITVHNCGPHEVTLSNSLVNVAGQRGPLKWSTEILKQGIPKGGSVASLRFTQPNQGIASIKQGYGGQYYNDTQNQNLFSEEDTSSNILWESFNTKYEVYRAGVVSNIDGGWSNHSGETLGVKNTGVTSKGTPVRVFTANSGLQIVDYNIGNVVSANSYKGDYSHLPKLKPGEQIDLFFGLRVNKLSDFSEKVQIVINSDDGTDKKMDCFGNYEFTIKIPSDQEGVGSTPPISPVIMPEPEPEPELEPEVDPNSPEAICAEKFQLRSKIFKDLTVDTAAGGMFAVFPGYTEEPIQKPYQGIGATGWYVINTETNQILDWRAILTEAGYGETLFWSGAAAGGDIAEWLDLVVGGLPATPGIILNEQGIAAGLKQWPTAEVSYSSQGGVGFVPGSPEFAARGTGTDLKVLPESNTIKNFYKSVSGKFYETISQCLYFPEEEEGVVPHNAQVFLSIVRGLCQSSPPETEEPTPDPAVPATTLNTVTSVLPQALNPEGESLGCVGSPVECWIEDFFAN